MKSPHPRSAALAVAILLAAVQAFSQGPNTPLKAYFTVSPPTGVTAEEATTTPTALPTWTFLTVAGKDGKLHSGKMVGQNVLANPKGVTAIPTYVIPLIVNIGSQSFDPTQPNRCFGNNGSNDVDLVLGSPIFQSAPFTMNGVDIGGTQYIDAYQRANFWSVVGGTNYHTLLSYAALPAVTVPAALTANGVTSGNGCGTMGVINYVLFDLWVRTSLLPSLASSGVSPSMLPVFILHNVGFSTASPPNFTNCCVLGYHGANGNPIQTYSVADFDSTGRFGLSTDTSILSHEIAEWMDDPTGFNAVPQWGNIGQVSGCQSNLENGDALTGSNFATVAMPNGVSYHLQELAFYSWFFNAPGTPSIGAGGKYSNNGTFTGPSKACPPGGTN